ncbi:hypothetical protein GCM10010402_66160 [Actinomadura luteofluorescens]|uniref:hypothetical protein n=1 Tax=Actinomadura luteofluorescens TaxID=46163 RepID=UPI002164E872|nr:hypothetical protein [Actinomadura glauciflava]MCR3744212.1 hypothetical protein [Actinomadura glauciflava]
MATYTITAQNGEYSGEVAGISFSRGVGEAVDPAPNVLAYFARHGYEVARKGGRKAAPAKTEAKTPAKDGAPPKGDDSSDSDKGE